MPMEDLSLSPNNPIYHHRLEERRRREWDRGSRGGRLRKSRLIEEHIRVMSRPHKLGYMTRVKIPIARYNVDVIDDFGYRRESSYIDNIVESPDEVFSLGELFNEDVTEVDSPSHSHRDLEDETLLPDIANDVESHAVADNDNNVEFPIEEQNLLASPVDIENHIDVLESPDFDVGDLHLEDQMLLPGHTSYGQRIRRWWKSSSLRRFVRSLNCCQS